MAKQLYILAFLKMYFFLSWTVLSWKGQVVKNMFFILCNEFDLFVDSVTLLFSGFGEQ